MTQPPVSDRINCTDHPVIAITRRMTAMRPDVMSLGQGVVHWPPPQEALDAATLALKDASCACYGPNEGLPALREALKKKVAERNGLHGYDICVTNGGNQAYMNLVISLVDEGEQVVLFRPAYFDHIMSFQMTGSAESIVYGESDPVTLKPDIGWLRHALLGRKGDVGKGRIKMVTIVNPNNPTGVLLSKLELEEIADICRQANCWLVMDNTYEDFSDFDDIVTRSACGSGGEPMPTGHYCVNAPHVVHIFSFSKAFGMMGWRVGYIAYQDPPSAKSGLGVQLLKTQDTMVICVNQPAQHAALAAVTQSTQYVRDRVAALDANRVLLLDALSVLGPGSVVGGSAIYFWVKLPAGCEDDIQAVEFLVKHFGIMVVPGSSCKGRGYVRVAFGNLQGEGMIEAAARLKAGLSHLVAHGMTAPAAAAAAPAAAVLGGQ